LMFMLRNRAPDRFTDGRAKGLNAMDHTRLEQEKKKWRKEWELEQDASARDAGDVRASLDRKIENIRLRVEAEQKKEWESLSDETREAWLRFEALKQRDLNEPTLLENTDRSATSGPQGRLAARSDSEDIAPEDAGAENKIKTIKDDSWD